LPVDGAHFDRWLALFEATARELCPPKAADHLIERARRIAESLELGIAGAHGALLRKGERFERPGLHATEGATVQDALPAGMKAYKRTPVFDQESLPAGLRRRHCTKAGVWALIHVLQGSLQYRTFDPASETDLTPQKPGVARPGQLHEVQPLGPVRMFVEFYAATDVGSRPQARRLLSSSGGASEPDAPRTSAPELRTPC
jgi:tellurite resistance-related uncharacterized protein